MQVNSGLGCLSLLFQVGTSFFMAILLVHSAERLQLTKKYMGGSSQSSAVNKLHVYFVRERQALEVSVGKQNKWASLV